MWGDTVQCGCSLCVGRYSKQCGCSLCGEIQYSMDVVYVWGDTVQYGCNLCVGRATYVMYSSVWM